MKVKRHFFSEKTGKKEKKFGKLKKIFQIYEKSGLGNSV
jgi:hypothetical protein